MSPPVDLAAETLDQAERILSAKGRGLDWERLAWQALLAAIFVRFERDPRFVCHGGVWELVRVREAREAALTRQTVEPGGDEFGAPGQYSVPSTPGVSR